MDMRVQRKDLPLVIPSSMVLHTPIIRSLVVNNPRLARDVITALNRVDRSRNTHYRRVLGDLARKARNVLRNW